MWVNKSLEFINAKRVHDNLKFRAGIQTKFYCLYIYSKWVGYEGQFTTALYDA